MASTILNHPCLKAWDSSIRFWGAFSSRLCFVSLDSAINDGNCARPVFNQLHSRKMAAFTPRRFFLAMAWVLMFLPGLLWAQSAAWTSVGTPTGFSEGSAAYLSQALDTSTNPSTPYVAYSDLAHGGKLSVMKFNGSNWVYVGTAGFSPIDVMDTSLAVINGVPYVAYQAGADSQKRGAVMKFDGTKWEHLGSSGASYFSTSTALSLSLTLSASGTPYVAYRDLGCGETITATNPTDIGDDVSVKKFAGGSWEYVGSPCFSRGRMADFISLKLDASERPYVAFEDWGNGYGISVMRFNGSSWVYVGDKSFSGQAIYASLALDTSTNPATPYVAFRKDYSGDFKAAVMKFNGTSWVYVGGRGPQENQGFSEGSARHVSLVLNTSTNPPTPYVAYQDLTTGGRDVGGERVSVMKFDAASSHWVYVGIQGFSTGEAHDVSLDLSDNGLLHVAYMNWSNDDKAAVMKFNDAPVPSAAPAITTQPQDSSITAGDNTTFTVVATSAPTPTYQWQSSMDGGGTWSDVAGATSATLTLTNVSVTNNGHQYRCIITNDQDTVTSRAATLTVADGSGNGNGQGTALFDTDIQKAYIAFFNRPADAPGMAFWMNHPPGGMQVLLAEFARSEEYLSDYRGLNHVDTLTRVYRHLFGRDPEPEGLNYWSAQMEAGWVTIANVAYEVLGGARNEDFDIIQNKVLAANAFTGTLDTPEKIEAYNNAGPNGLGNEAKNWLAAVNEYAASVQEATAKLAVLLNILVNR